MLGCCLNYFHFLWAILRTSTVLYFETCGLNVPSCVSCVFFSPLSYDVRGNGVEIGRHWNDGVNLGARARFENDARPPAPPVLWIDDLREEDRGAYRCRVDFRQAPTRNARINLQVIGELRALEQVALSDGGGIFVESVKVDKIIEQKAFFIWSCFSMKCLKFH